MKKNTTSKRLLILFMGLLAGSSLLLNSCSKKEDTLATKSGTTAKPTGGASQAQKDAAVKFFKSIPAIRIQAGKYGFTMPNPLRDNGFNFADASSGSNFSTSSNVQIVTDPNTGGSVLVLTSSGASSNAGGTVVAGSSSLDINLAFCYSASDNAGSITGSLGSAGDSLGTGVSMVIGIAGDIDALINGNVDPDADITDYFHGIAIYIVYTDQASGDYEVLDWTNLGTDTDDKAVSMLFDFTNGKGYISSSGSLSVDANSMGFSGNYYQLFLDDDDAIAGSEVSGFGTMGCQ